MSRNIRQNPNKFNRNVKCLCRYKLRPSLFSHLLWSRTRGAYLTNALLGYNHRLHDQLVLISLALFLGGIREPRGSHWPFPYHTMLYHFNSSFYDWREMEKGHFACVFSCTYIAIVIICVENGWSVKKAPWNWQAKKYLNIIEDILYLDVT